MSLPAPKQNRRRSSPSKDRVVLLPCAAGATRQWTPLADALEDFAPISLDLIGQGARACWQGAGSLREAAAIDAAVPGGAPFHLVGHSYAGAVALRYAQANPHRLLSLTLVEPSAFHVLKSASPDEARFLGEIREVFEAVNIGVISGDHEGAMEAFIDYWSGGGSWRSLSDEQKAKLSELAGHVAHHFWGLLEEPAALADYAAIDVPTLLLCGTRSPAPSRAITRLIADTLPHAQHRTIPGAGHLSPLTHAAAINRHIVAHIEGHRRAASTDKIAA